METLSASLSICVGIPITDGFPTHTDRNVGLGRFLLWWQEQAFEHTVELLVIWDVIVPMSNVMIQQMMTRSCGNIQYVMTSLNRNMPALLSLCEGKPPVTSWTPSQRPVMRNLYGISILILFSSMKPGDQQLWYEITIFWSSLRLNVSVSNLISMG